MVFLFQFRVVANHFYGSSNPMGVGREHTFDFDDGILIRMPYTAKYFIQFICILIDRGQMNVDARGWCGLLKRNLITRLFEKRIYQQREAYFAVMAYMQNMCIFCGLFRWIQSQFANNNIHGIFPGWMIKLRAELIKKILQFNWIKSESELISLELVKCPRCACSHSCSSNKWYFRSNDHEQNCVVAIHLMLIVLFK